MGEQAGKWIVFIGLGLIVLGGIIYYFYDALTWLGRLPGDIRIERDNFRLYIPITTMVLFSVLITLLILLIQWFNR